MNNDQYVDRLMSRLSKKLVLRIKRRADGLFICEMTRNNKVVWENKTPYKKAEGLRRTVVNLLMDIKLGDYKWEKGVVKV